MADRKPTQSDAPEQFQWYKEAVIYELHVKAFHDGDGDGVGDFKGLTSKLDYLQDLGITALWLLPFTSSPMRDDGYDTADYRQIHPTYGTLREFKQFVREAHRRGLKIITELVLNHTSDQHPWFQKARRARPGTKLRNYYVWSDDPEKYAGTRIIFQDFETSNWTWDPLARAYYWHRFYSHQPDLNYANPEVRKEMLKAIDYWFGMGVDGLRLDAVPYLFEREGTNCENLPETHDFLKALRAHVDRRFQNRLLLAEANQWPEDAAAYFGDGDECHMAFHFPVMPRLFMALRMEDRFPIIDIMDQTPAIPETCQWAIFLRNHDELTLEMVTDEERDFMYRAYANDPKMRVNLGIRRRLATLLNNHRRRIELMNALLLSLPGTPVLYYGDEIGMGDNIYLGDRDGVRTPMQWNVDRNAGFSLANPQSLYLPVIIDPEYHFQAVNVEAQQKNPSSLLWWTRRLIALRKLNKAFGLGDLNFLYPENNKILAFTREYGAEKVLVLVNLSRFIQYTHIDLSAYRGMKPVEMFGRTDFPAITEQPYFMTMGPHSFFWFELRPDTSAFEIAAAAEGVDLPLLTVERQWRDLFKPEAMRALVEVMAGWLPRQRWFGDKARKIKTVRVQDVLPFPAKKSAAYIIPSQVEFTEGDPRVYVPVLTLVDETLAEEIATRTPEAILARVGGKTGRQIGFLCDAMFTPEFPRLLLEFIGRRQAVETPKGALVPLPEPAFLETESPASGESKALRGEQTNTSVIFGDKFIMKLFRGLEEGVSTDYEIVRILTRMGFPNTPPLAGAVEYRPTRGAPSTIVLVQNFVPNQGDAWEYTLGVLSGYYERVMARPGDAPELALPQESLMETAARNPEDGIWTLIGPYLESARLIGRNTAAMHAALASVKEEPDFAPEPFTSLYLRSLYQSMRNLTGNVLRTLRRGLDELPAELGEKAAFILDRGADITGRFRWLLDVKDPGRKIRIHGDYHLGQLLFTGKDFFIIDFEGEPARPLSERRKKYSPLRDVAGMLRSFHYAAYAGLFRQSAAGLSDRSDWKRMEGHAEFWVRWVSAVFLKSYLVEAESGDFLPDASDIAPLLDIYLLEKAVYELGYELNNRPNWAAIPLSGIALLLESRNR